MAKVRALLSGIERRSVSDVKALLARGASADGSRWRRLFAYHEPTPMMAAVCARSLEIVGLLLDHGANPDRDSPGWPSPLSLACGRGDRAIAELLLERGANVNGVRARGQRPLEAASWYAQEELVVMLLDRGADPQPVMDRGVGSLLRVRPSIVEKLIEAGGIAPPEIVEVLAAEKRRRKPTGRSPGG